MDRAGYEVKALPLVRTHSFRRCLVLTAALLPFLPIVRAGTSDGPPTADPAQLYQQSCAACHDHPKDRIPARATIARHSS